MKIAEKPAAGEYRYLRFGLEEDRRALTRYCSSTPTARGGRRAGKGRLDFATKRGPVLIPSMARQSD